MRLQAAVFNKVTHLARRARKTSSEGCERLLNALLIREGIAESCAAPHSVTGVQRCFDRGSHLEGLRDCRWAHMTVAQP